MRPTGEIDDPTWHDVFDRDDEIKRLKRLLTKKSELIERLIDSHGESVRDFTHHVDEKEALIAELHRELVALRNRDNRPPTSGEEGR